jgi:HEAT repeat protein
LRDAIKDPNSDVRVAACKGLEKQPGPEATAALAEVLGSDVEMEVRLAAARALGERREESAIRALGSALEDRDPAMQYCAVNSLRKIAPEDLGNDVSRWRQFVRGETPSPPKPVSLAERIRGVFY